MLAGHGPGHGQCLRSRVHQSLLVSHHKCAQHSIASARRRAHQCRVSARESGKACRGSHLQETSSFSRDEEDEVSSFREGVRLPTQGESLVRGVDTPALQLKERERDDGPPDFMFLSVRFQCDQKMQRLTRIITHTELSCQISHRRCKKWGEEKEQDYSLNW